MNSQIQSETVIGREFDTVAARERKEMLEKELERYLRILIEEEDPELILIFGSMVTGEIHEWSDIDLMVVQETKLPFMKRLHHLRALLQPQVAVDILSYTPSEFDQMARERSFFRHEILGKGAILYERRGSTLAELRAGRPTNGEVRAR